MVTTEIVNEAAKGGLPALKDLFEKLPKEDALKGIGILVIARVGMGIINVIKEIVTGK